MPNLGPQELFLILMIVFLLFGATKLPMIGEGLGKGIRSFRKALGGDPEEPEKLPPKDSEDKADKES